MAKVPRDARRTAWTAAAVALAALPATARAGDDQPVDVGDAVLVSGPGPSNWRSPYAPPAPAEPRSALREAVECAVGAEVHGRFTLKWQSRILHTEKDRDHDLAGILDLRVGDETKDRWSANVFTRANWDLDQPNSHRQGHAFWSLSDTYDTELSALLYGAYATWRPSEGGKVERVRMGRQYVDVAETFHMDGVSAATRPLHEATKLRLEGYAGVPVHFYEARSGGDWLGGVQATAEPWKRGRAALDFAHVQDDYAGYGEERNDLVAAQAWHSFSERLSAYGRFTWLDQARDAKARVSWQDPERDLLVQATYFRMLNDEELLATEFDPYYAVLRTIRRYQTGDMRVVKGVGDHLSVEAGASARRLLDDDDEGAYNRETTRIWLMPTVSDVLWDGLSVSVGGEQWAGDDERIRTWTADVTHRFSRDLKASVGSDWSLYDWDELRLGEREDVRTIYGRINARLSKTVTLDVRYSWERDERETYHVFTLALAFDF